MGIMILTIVIAYCCSAVSSTNTLTSLPSSSQTIDVDVRKEKNIHQTTTLPPRKLINSMNNGPRHFSLNRIDADLNEHQRNNRRLFYRRRKLDAKRRLPSPPKSQIGKPHFPASQKLPPYKAEGTLTREPDGVYFTVVRIGTNQRGNGIPFTLIADTGSSTIAVPCKGCTCGATKHYYDMFGSKTARDPNQSYSQCYGEGSCNSGKKIQDLMCFGPDCESNGGVMQSFGCCSKYAPSFQEQVADGIIGLGHSNTLVKALQNEGELLAHQFAMCVGPEKGRLTVGGCE